MDQASVVALLRRSRISVVDGDCLCALHSGMVPLRTCPAMTSIFELDPDWYEVMVNDAFIARSRKLLERIKSLDALRNQVA